MKTSNLSEFIKENFMLVLHEKNVVRELTPREVEDLIDKGKKFKILSHSMQDSKLVVHLIYN